MRSRKPLPSLVLALILLAALACRTEATPTPVPTPAPTAAPTATAVPTATPAPTPTSTAEPAAEPYDGAMAFAGYWNPPTDYYGEPVYGGTLRIAYEDPLEHANVWGAFSGVTLRYRVPTGATLVMENPYDPGGPVIPDLAKDWTIHESLDGVTFHFREGVTWHNGEPFFCEDARFSFETMITGEGLTRSSMQNRLAHVVLEEMTCRDDLTLEVKFDGPTAIPLHAFSNHRALIFNKAWFLEGGEEAMFQDVSVGIGPFVWQERQQVGVDEQRFSRNHNYFIPELPYVDKLVIYGILDEATQQATILAHQADWHWVRNWQQYEAYVDHDQIMTVIRPTRGNFRFWINARNEPFDNVKVRQAIVMGIDRNAAIRELQDGYGALGGFGYAASSPWALPHDQLCSVPGWCVSEDMEGTRAEARAILEAEGFDFDKTFIRYVEPDLQIVERATFLQEQLLVLGIKTDFYLTENPRPRRKNEFPEDFYPIYGGVHSRTPNSGAEYYLRCDSPYRVNANMGACDESIDALLDHAQVEIDPVKRRALAHEIELAALKQYKGFPIYWEQKAAAFWPEVRGYVHFPSPSGSFLKFMQLWIDPTDINDTGYAGQTTGVPGGM